MLKSSLCDYSDAYILVKGTITITEVGANPASRNADERNKQVTFKHYVLFTDHIIKINSTQIYLYIYNAKNMDVVTPMYNLIEHSDNYAKTLGNVLQYHKDDPNDNITDSESFKFKAKITGRNLAAGNTKDIEIVVPLKYLSNFCRTLESVSE